LAKNSCYEKLYWVKRDTEKNIRNRKLGLQELRRCYERLPPPWGVRVPEKQRALALPNGI
jgi:hypothetical protein